MQTQEINTPQKTLSEIELFKEWLDSQVAEYDTVGNIICEYRGADLLEPCFDYIQLSYTIGDGLESISEELSFIEDNLRTALAHVEFASKSFNDLKETRIDLAEQSWEATAIAAEANPRYLAAENSDLAVAGLSEFSSRRKIYAEFSAEQLMDRLCNLESQFLASAGQFSDFDVRNCSY